MKINRSIKLLTAMGMFEKTPNGPAKLNERILSDFSERKRTSDWFHMGCSNLSIGKLINVVGEGSNISIPRTGHLGNWHEISRGRSGALDHNFVVCGERALGYPLIYDFNQVEDDALTRGDSVYLPGSLVENGKRNKLEIFHWDRGKIRPCQSGEGLFSPFVQTPLDGSLISLVAYHNAYTNKYYGNAKNISSIILQNKKRVEEIIVFLVENAIKSSDPEVAFRRIIDRYITLEGRIHRANVSIKKGRIMIGDMSYEKSADMVKALMFSYYAANTPDDFFSNIKGVPKQIPLISITLNSVLLAVLNTHFPDCVNDRDNMTKPLNPHLEWGAFGKAGYPPLSRGYYRSKASDFKKLYQLIVDHFSDIDPIFYLLLPSTMFVLLPNDYYANDVMILNELFKIIYEDTYELSSKPNLLMSRIRLHTQKWLDSRGNVLSSYYKNKFTKKRSVFNGIIDFTESKAVEPEYFRDLSLQQACMLVGAMKEELIERGY